MGRNIPDPVFVGLVTFLMCGTLKSSQFLLYCGVVLFVVLLHSLSAIVVTVSSRDVCISSLGLLRDHVQISASGHTDADQSGAYFSRLCLQSVPIETESATGQTSSSGQLTEVIKS